MVRVRRDRNLVQGDLGPYLDGIELGTWTMGHATLAFIDAELRRLRPDAILELGSGVSTLVVARTLSRIHGTDSGTRMMSLDQDPAFADRTRALLRSAGLATIATVVDAPLERQVLAGRSTVCYRLPVGAPDLLGDRSVQYVIIDGPAGDGDVRFGTQAIARKLLTGTARFVMDDALRTGELAIARVWRGIEGVEIEGIRLIDKGLLVGTFMPKSLGTSTH